MNAQEACRLTEHVRKVNLFHELQEDATSWEAFKLIQERIQEAADCGRFEVEVQTKDLDLPTTGDLMGERLFFVVSVLEEAQGYNVEVKPNGSSTVAEWVDTYIRVMWGKA